MSKLRNKQRSKAIKTGRDEDWKTYKSTRNKVNNMKKYAREAFYNGIEFSLTDSFMNNKKYFWKLVRFFVKDSNSSSTIPPLKSSEDNNEVLHFSDFDKANCLNDYFVSISTVNDENAGLPHFTPKTDQELNTVAVLESEVKDILKTLSVNKACGNDFISHKMLKGVANSISKPLSILFNLSLQECKFPSSWKVANVIPLFKKGCPHTPSNYRPISLLSCVGKVMERIIFKNIYNHLHSNNLLYERQSGFLPGHSTVYQLIDIYDQICKSFER